MYPVSPLRILRFLRPDLFGERLHGYRKMRLANLEKGTAHTAPIRASSSQVRNMSWLNSHQSYLLRFSYLHVLRCLQGGRGSANTKRPMGLILAYRGGRQPVGLTWGMIRTSHPHHRSKSGPYPAAFAFYRHEPSVQFNLPVVHSIGFSWYIQTLMTAYGEQPR